MSSRAERVPEDRRIELINECRRSGLTDAEWCRQNGINPSTFYMWVSRCRKNCAAEKLIRPASGDIQPQPVVQEVVPVSIVPDDSSDEHTSLVSVTKEPVEPYPDNSHEIEVVANGITIRIRNAASSAAIRRVFRHLKEIGC